MDLLQHEIIAKVSTITPLYLVGGVVRDKLLDHPIKDIDGIVTLPLAELEKQLVIWGYNPHRIGARHQTLSVFKDGERIDFNPFDGDLTKDALRRDFTINAIFQDARTGEIIDPLQGKRDLEAKILRACGDPEARFSEDPVRILRMVRFSVKYGLNIEEETFKAAQNLLPHLQEVALERISEELGLILTLDNPVKGIRLLEAMGYLDLFMPEVSRLKGLVQNRYHTKDAWEHTLQVVSNTPPQLILRLAGLFHDLGKWEVAGRECVLRGKCLATTKGYYVGNYQILGRQLQRFQDKYVEILGSYLEHYPEIVQVKRIRQDPFCRKDFNLVEGGKRHFLGHEKESARLTRQILSRYRFSIPLGKEGLGREKELIWLVENHMSGNLYFVLELRGEIKHKNLAQKLRRFVWDKGWDGRSYRWERVQLFLELWRADFYGGKLRESQEEKYFDLLIERLQRTNLEVMKRHQELQWDELERFAREHKIRGKEFGEFKETLRAKLVHSVFPISLDKEYLEKEYKHFKGQGKMNRIKK